VEGAHHARPDCGARARGPDHGSLARADSAGLSPTVSGRSRRDARQAICASRRRDRPRSRRKGGRGRARHRDPRADGLFPAAGHDQNGRGRPVPIDLAHRDSLHAARRSPGARGPDAAAPATGLPHRRRAHARFDDRRRRPRDERRHAGRRRDGGSARRDGRGRRPALGPGQRGRACHDGRQGSVPPRGPGLRPVHPDRVRARGRPRGTAQRAGGPGRRPPPDAGRRGVGHGHGRRRKAGRRSHPAPDHDAAFRT
jgi:hypothetical protein